MRSRGGVRGGPLGGEDPNLYLNGIDGESGKHLFDKLSPAQVDAIIAGHVRGPWRRLFDSLAGGLRRLWEPVRGPDGPFATNDLAHAGWAVVIPEGADLLSPLAALIAHRATQVPGALSKVLTYRPDETADGWLARHDVSFGNRAPERVPYYLLLVGPPSAIPFEFQYHLDIEYAVGRLDFDDAAGYRRYAESVVRYEQAAAPVARRRCAFWGTRHERDPATEMSADNLIVPLKQHVDERLRRKAGPPVFNTELHLGPHATFARLRELLHPSGEAPGPAMLVTASHGAAWPVTWKRQFEDQGALVCHDWGGVLPVKAGQALRASDVSDDAQVHGMVAFLFACFSAGTPELDGYNIAGLKELPRLAPRPFTAALPQRLLSHPNGSALAVLGHIDRAWGYSCQKLGTQTQIEPIHRFVTGVLDGQPVGHATSLLNHRYAYLSTLLASDYDPNRRAHLGDGTRRHRWVERNDAQGYVLLGDPAVRLRAPEITA